MIAPGTFSWVKNNKKLYKSQFDMKRKGWKIENFRRKYVSAKKCHHLVSF